jgi:ribosomal protein S18 acetylase RimI-like enzyme
MPTGPIAIRDAVAADAEFLREMSLEAILWREDADRPPLAEILAIPQLAAYLAPWGRAGDAGLVAVAEPGERIGAVWLRRFAADAPGFGFVSEEIPELGIAVARGHRGRGAGRRLLAAMIDHGARSGLPGISLSVEDGNARAAHLYAALGFVQVARNGGAWTMLHPLR